MRTADLDFDLPSELIAQVPCPQRAESRLMHYRRADRSIGHRRFAELPDLLVPGDLLVFNNARVVPARFMLDKSTGGRVEGLFLEQTGPRRWRVMLKNAPARNTTPLVFSQARDVQARIVERDGEGLFTIEVDADEPALQLLSRIGRMPLPPYIRRKKDHDPRDELDRDRYQTVYAAAPGSVAAPTAGLHFTPELIEKLGEKGVERAFLTLHVGLGTFKPVSSESLEGHTMHVEHYQIDAACAHALNRARRDGRRIIAVGTTSARVLESQPPDQPFSPRDDKTGIFIYPPYRWRHVNALITNFHLPRSTLIALVAALVGLDEQRRLYAQAIAQRYRFFSYGDAMLIE